MTSIRSIVLALTLVISGCVPIYRHHGYIPPDEDLAQVVVGQTTQGDLETLIGRPSSQGLLAGSGWYYVGSRWRYYGPTRPTEVSREVVAITFTRTEPSPMLNASVWSRAGSWCCRGV